MVDDVLFNLNVGSKRGACLNIMKKRYLTYGKYAAIVIGLLAVSFFSYKWIQHEKWQNQQIKLLNEALARSQTQNQVEPEVNYSPTAYNYLALGNSITLHGKCDYWWNRVGMAASSTEKDYFHIVRKHIEDQHDEVVAFAYNYSTWEVNAHDRAETFEIIDPLLDSSLDLVTIQLSENAADLSTFQSDYIELIEHIKTKCPKAEIMLIDDFWNNKKSSIKKKVADKTNVRFISLKEIRGKKEYECGLGTVVYGDDDSKHIVEHDGVATHPGDKGMQYIADAVIKELDKTETQ